MAQLRLQRPTPHWPGIDSLQRYLRLACEASGAGRRRSQPRTVIRPTRQNYSHVHSRFHVSRYMVHWQIDRQCISLGHLGPQAVQPTTQGRHQVRPRCAFCGIPGRPWFLDATGRLRSPKGPSRSLRTNTTKPHHA